MKGGCGGDGGEARTLERVTLLSILSAPLELSLGLFFAVFLLSCWLSLRSSPLLLLLSFLLTLDS